MPRGGFTKRFSSWKKKFTASARKRFTKRATVGLLATGLVLGSRGIHTKAVKKANAVMEKVEKGESEEDPEKIQKLEDELKSLTKKYKKLLGYCPFVKEK